MKQLPSDGRVMVWCRNRSEMMPAEIVERYSKVTIYIFTTYVDADCDYGQYVEPERYRYNYPDLVDVVFDHEPDKVSQGHFTTA